MKNVYLDFLCQSTYQGYRNEGNRNVSEDLALGRAGLKTMSIDVTDKTLLNEVDKVTSKHILILSW